MLIMEYFLLMNFKYRFPYKYMVAQISLNEKKCVTLLIY